MCGDIFRSTFFVGDTSELNVDSNMIHTFWLIFPFLCLVNSNLLNDQNALWPKRRIPYEFEDNMSNLSSVMFWMSQILSNHICCLFPKMNRSGIGWLNCSTNFTRRRVYVLFDENPRQGIIYPFKLAPGKHCYLIWDDVVAHKDWYSLRKVRRGSPVNSLNDRLKLYKKIFFSPH